MTPAPTTGSRVGTTRERWIMFGLLAAILIVADQGLKAWVVASFRVGEPVQVFGDTVRITLSHNQGALFGMFQGSAVLFGLASLVVVGLIVWYEAQAGGSLLTTIALGLLLGGAGGNLIDRFRLGYVIDFVDAGVGTTRWFTFNLADATIDAAILLLILIAILPARRTELPA